MNATIDLLRARRSVPPLMLRGPGPSVDEVALILTLAARVPDHGKLAPWRFIVFEGDSRDRAAAIVEAAFKADNPDADAARLKVERDRLTLAPLIVAVVATAKPHVKIPEWEQELSAGAVCMNLIVAANALGYATSWLTQWFAFDRRVLAAFGIAADERVAGFIHIGRAAETPPDRERPALADIVTRF